MATIDRQKTARIPRRLACVAYEALLVAGVVVVTVILPNMLLGAFFHHIASPRLLWAQVFAVMLGYCVFFWCRRGQTLAMKTWQIRLITADGQPLRPMRALARFLLCWPSYLLLGTGVIWALFDPDRQFLHDRLAGTRLVRVSP